MRTTRSAEKSRASRFRRLQVTTDCIDYCHARYHGVYGREHHYPLDELQYHQQHSFAEMRKYFPTQR